MKKHTSTASQIVAEQVLGQKSPIQQQLLILLLVTIQLLQKYFCYEGMYVVEKKKLFRNGPILLAI